MAKPTTRYRGARVMMRQSGICVADFDGSIDVTVVKAIEYSSLLRGGRAIVVGDQCSRGSCRADFSGAERR